MRFVDLLRIVHDQPVFETSLLLAGAITPAEVHRQLSRWVRAGKVIQLRRGLYTLAPEYRRFEPHPFVIANRLDHGSYVSLESALSYYGLVPEFVATTTSVTTRRPRAWQTALGRFSYRHVKHPAFFGYLTIMVTRDQRALIAAPAKALIDLLYLNRDAADPAYLAELRLDLATFDWDAAHRATARLGSRNVAEALTTLRALSE